MPLEGYVSYLNLKPSAIFFLSASARKRVGGNLASSGSKIGARSALSDLMHFCKAERIADLSLFCPFNAMQNMPVYCVRTDRIELVLACANISASASNESVAARSVYSFCSSRGPV